MTICLSEQHGKDTFNITMSLNIIILVIAGLLFGWEKALYSIIFQFVAAQVLHGMYKRYQQKTLLIIAVHPDEISEVIRRITNHGATLFKGEGNYEHKERTMVYSVVSADEVNKVVAGVRATDKGAFVNSIKTDSITGTFYRQPNG